MGIEHPQMDAVTALFTGSPAGFAPEAGLMTLGAKSAKSSKTPNQRALACAIALSWARQSHGQPPPMSQADAVAQTRDLFRAMADCGHQAVGMTFGCEEGAPDPHSALWLGALATILREARLQQLGDLLNAAIGYFADHIALCRAFWTPAGVRTACARAKTGGGKPLRPNWSVDSMAYAMVCGLPKTGLAKADPAPLKVLEDSASLFSQIVDRSQTTKLKLAVPIRRWKRPDGGFVAAMVQDVPMNDRCSWLIVDAGGTILDAANTLSSFATPAGDPVVIGGDALVPSEPKEPQIPKALGLPALAAEVRSLLLPKSQAALKESAAKAIEEGRLADALPLVNTFAIGDGQPQAVTWKAIRAELSAKSSNAGA